MADKPCSHTELIARVTELGGNILSFKELMDERDKRYAQRAASQDQAVALSLAASEKAITKAEQATERRLESLNELRGVVVDQSKDFSRAAEVKLAFDAIANRITGLSELVHTFSTQQTSKAAGAREVISYLVGAGGIIAAFLAAYFRH